MSYARIVALAIALMFGGSAAHAEADHAAIAKAALTKMIQPGYATLTASTGILKERAQALCAAPSAAGLDAMKHAFAAVVDSWSKVEILRFGPITEDHRYERLFYWPDPKGLGLRQVQAALTANDPSVTEANTLAAKSVALQGLPALEFLLYGDGAETLTQGDPDVGFRCNFASAVATNVDHIARDVAESWRDGAAFTKSYLSPGPDDPLYRAPQDVTLELSKAFTSGIELVRDQKLGKPLGTSPETARPRLAAFWRSGLTFQNMVGNLDAVRRLFIDSGFAGVVAAQSPGVENSVLFDLHRVINILGAVDEPIAEMVTDPVQRAKLEALRVALKSARDTGASLIAQGAGLSFGFNAMDGD